MVDEALKCHPHILIVNCLYYMHKPNNTNQFIECTQNIRNENENFNFKLKFSMIILC